MKAKQEVRKEILSDRNQMTHDEVMDRSRQIIQRVYSEEI